MNARVATYLDSLGLTEAMRFRIESLITNYEELLDDELGDVILSEYISDDVGRVFESVWAFTDDLIMEAPVASDEGDQFDFVPLRRSVRHWVIKAKDYRRGAAEDTSRLSMEVWLADERVARLRASGRNCDHLMTVGRARILQNLAPLASGDAD